MSAEPITPETLAKLRELAGKAKAYNQPWFSVEYLTGDDPGMQDMDAHFIAAANPATVLALVEEVERAKTAADLSAALMREARAEVERLRQELADQATDYNGWISYYDKH